jgi:hypothetical protein
LLLPLELIVLGACLVIGFIANRWWLAVAAGLGVGIYFAVNGRVELDHSLFGLLVGLLVALPMLAGVGLRHLASWLLEQRRS